ncbi:DNA-3-methyladenine glycosylase-like isoform X4 [Branchiostoma floridae x Branchiostoma belcheri]
MWCKLTNLRMADVAPKMSPLKSKKHKLSEASDCPVKAKVKTKAPTLPDATTREGSAVLIRAVQPLTGVDRMKVQRGQRRGDKGAGLKTEQLGNGPSKLCQALHIDKNTVNQQDLTTCPFIWLEPREDVKDADIIHSTRIGIDSSGEEWAKKPWRFYFRGNKSVSVRDKKAEETEKL